MTKIFILSISAGLALAIVACGSDDDEGGGGGDGNASGTIQIDGSSTVGPFAQAAAEEFQGQNSDVRISVGSSGTGGGFEKFCAGETDISNASRPIKDDEEAPICKKAGIKYTEIQVANDGIAVVTNPAVAVDCMTVEELKTAWNEESRAKSFSDLNPDFPDSEMSLYGPGTDSGTFDFFTDEINGEEGVSRKDYQPSEDDNVLVQGVAGDEGGFGYFGFSYYEQSQDQLNLVGIDGGDGCVKPSAETIQDGSYRPLSRPLFMYVNNEAAKEPAVAGFLDYVVQNQQTIADTALIVGLTDEQATKAQEAVATVTGS